MNSMSMSRSLKLLNVAIPNDKSWLFQQPGGWCAFDGGPGWGSEAIIHLPNVWQAFLLGGYPQKHSEIHESFASMDPDVPRLDKWKGFAGRVAYRFYMFDWFPSRGIADVISNWCFFLTNLAESSRIVFLNYCFLLISEWWIYHFTCVSYSYKLLKWKERCVNLFRSKFPQAFQPGFSFTSTCGVTGGGWSPKSYVWTPVGEWKADGFLLGIGHYEFLEFIVYRLSFRNHWLRNICLEPMNLCL